MKKLIIVLSLAFILFSCDDGGVENENKNTNAEPKYFTVTYHSDEHTSGEVPIDPNKYKEPIRNYLEWTRRPEIATILGPGTLEREGHIFSFWRYRHPNGGYYNSDLNEGDKLEVHEDIHLDAFWWTSNKTN